MDWDGPVNTGHDNIVEVPDTNCPLNDQNLTLLNQTINPQSDDGNYGISHYIDTVAQFNQLLQNQ